MSARRVLLIVGLSASAATLTACSHPVARDSHPTSTTLVEREHSRPSGPSIFGSTATAGDVSISVSAPATSKINQRTSATRFTFTVGVVNHSKSPVDVSDIDFAFTSSGGSAGKRVDAGGPLNPIVKPDAGIAFRVTFDSSDDDPAELTAVVPPASKVTFTASQHS